MSSTAKSRSVGPALAAAFLLSIAPSAGAVGLVFDHEGRAWSVPADPTKVQVEDGLPTLYLKRGDTLDVTVENSNALLYSAEFGELTEEPEASVEGLKTLFGLLSGVFQAALPARAAATKAAESRAAGGREPAQPSPDNVIAAATLLNEMLRDLSRARATAVAYIQALEERPPAAGPWTRLTFPMASPRPTVCGAPPAAQPLAQITWIFNCLSAALGAYAAQPLADADLVGKAETLLAAEGELQTAAVRLLRFEAQVCRADPAPTATTCTPALAALTRLPVGRWSSAARWDKVQVQEVKIVATSPFEESLVPRLGEVAPKIRIRWVYADLFGFGVGITHTQLASPTFSAVGPDDADKVVTKTGESSRSGNLALFVNYSFLSHLRPRSSGSFVRPGLELGAGLDDDTPAAFAGLSLSIGRYARLGFGRTWQEVDVLDGQVAGVTTVPDDDAIQTRKRFAEDTYVSFAFAIDSLSLFSKKE